MDKTNKTYHVTSFFHILEVFLEKHVGINKKMNQEKDRNLNVTVTSRILFNKRI